VLADPKKVRQVIGLAGQYASVEPAMTGIENLEMVARLFGLDRATPSALPATCSSASASPRPARRWCATTPAACAAGSTSAPASSGARDSCCSTSPPPVSTRAAAASCGTPSATSSADGTDVLLTTQYLEEADQLARDVVIIDHGRVIASGTPDELKDQAGSDVIEVRPRRPATSTPSPRSWRRSAPRPPRIDDDTHRVTATVDGGAGELAAVVRLLDERGLAGRRHRPPPSDPRRGVPHPDRPTHRPERRPDDAADAA
jgi:ABC-2 type transport system ATP-binding protein